MNLIELRDVREIISEKQITKKAMSTDNLQESLLSNNPQSELLNPQSKPSVEEALQKVGDEHKYQIRILLIFFVQWMVSVFVFVGPSYFFPDPVFICEGDQTCNEDNGGCVNQILQPSEYITITSDFKLYCDQASQRSIAQSALFWGPIIGNIFFSFLADWKGRRISLIIAWSLTCLGLIGICLSKEPYQLIITILLTGFSLVPCNNLNLIIINEQSGEIFRQRGSTYLLMSWAVFGIILVPIAKYIKDWRDIFFYFTTLPALVIAVFTFLYIYESPRFYLAKDSRENMYKTLNAIANVNNKEELSESTYKIPQAELVTGAQRIYTYADLFKFSSLRKITAASCIVMFCTQMIYYTTQYSLDSLGEDLYLNALIVSAGEAIAYLASNRFIAQLPRKRYTLIFFTSSIILSACFFFAESQTAQTIITGLVRICNCSTLAILALFTEELYPTTVRSLGVGVQMSIGVAGSSLAPIIIEQAKKLNIKALAAAAVISIPAIASVSLFEETKGKPLKDEIQELKDKNNSLLSFLPSQKA